jgi:predicted transcriptional regulator
MKKHRALLSDQLRQAISASSLTRYRISQETGISQAALSLFCARKRGLSLPSIDALGALLNLELKTRKRKES